MDFYRRKGIKKTQRKYGVSSRDLAGYEKWEKQMKELVKNGIEKDAKLSAKRKGSPIHSNEKRALKRRRMGKAESSVCLPGPASAGMVRTSPECKIPGDCENGENLHVLLLLR